MVSNACSVPALQASRLNLRRVSRASARDARSNPGCHIAGFQPASEIGKNVQTQDCFNAVAQRAQWIAEKNASLVTSPCLLRETRRPLASRRFSARCWCDSQCRVRFSPNGAASQSPRLPQRGYLGSSFNPPSNRNAVLAHPLPLVFDSATTPLALFPIRVLHRGRRCVSV